MVQRLPYGSWPSPVSPDMAVAAGARLTDVRAEGELTWWSQSRPEEGGRIQIVRREPDGTVAELLGEGFNARTRVHEYGGGAWWVDRQRVFFANFADQRLYRIDPGGEPVPITEEPARPHALRYADGCLTPDGGVVVCVRERHHHGTAKPSDGTPSVDNEIVALPAGGGAARILAGGRDFYAAPRISPDGAHLAWLTWDHPRMPWDGTELWLADLAPDGGTLAATGHRRLAGGPGESLTQPEWSAGGELHVVSDRSGWWNVYRVGRSRADDVEPVHPVAAEVGLPAWVFGRDRYTVDAAGTVVFTYSDGAGAHLVTVPRDGAAADRLTGGLHLEPLHRSGDRLVAIVMDAAREASALAGTSDGRSWTALLTGPDHGLPAVSSPRRVSFPSADGRTAHGWFYAPTAAGIEAPPGERPPALVQVHGGPTASADAAFSLATQFWTSRGFAVMKIDYGGSTGYGRSYRRLLDGAWGIVDVQDAVAAARWLADRDLADPARTAITGGSAGGYTALMALATCDTFAAGASYYGVSDLGALARDTHKFESRYLDGLVGPWPEAEQVYRDRSPLSHLDGFDRPLIVFQGLEDEIVPPSQSQMIVDALRRRGVPHAYLTFEGEQHGFRRGQTIRRALTAELYFYSRVFGIALADDIEPVEIVGG